MTPEDISEVAHISRQLADMEIKLASWRKSRDMLNSLIEQSIKRMETLNQRIKALMENKV